VQFVCSKMFPVGHLTTHIALLIENTSQYVGVLGISNYKRLRLQRSSVCVCVSHIIDPQIFIILLDIEGTTTPIDFVFQTLFPYALRRLPTFLQKHFQEPETKSLIQHLCTCNTKLMIVMD
jgi:hypothetical protein